MSGPMTRASEIRGWSGKAAIAIANDSGEFLARDVNVNATESPRWNPSRRPTACDASAK